MKTQILAPSLLSADFSTLGSEIKKIEDNKGGAVHIDVMDGSFVPEITYGEPVIRSIRKLTKLPFDVHLMIDEPGRYIYIRDNKDGDYWSASWQPVAKDLKEYQCECRHGMSYTTMAAQYKKIKSEVTYYVPMNKSYEVWYLSVTNESDEDRELNITGYAEFTNNSNYEQDQVNLQYSQFITRTVFRGNRVRQMIHGNLDQLEEGKDVDDKIVVSRFFGLAGSEVSSWCGDKEQFLGRYCRYGNPQGVTNGVLSNTGNYNENSCGALTTTIRLAKGETKHLCFLVGMKEDEEAAAIVSSYEDIALKCREEIQTLKTYWHEKFAGICCWC